MVYVPVYRHVFVLHPENNYRVQTNAHTITCLSVILINDLILVQFRNVAKTENLIFMYQRGKCSFNYDQDNTAVHVSIDGH
jgi:hypothetical protein